MNLLGAARLSHDTESSTSIERQVEQIQHAVAARGDVLVDVTVDTDVSGAVPPHLRPGLGPWVSRPELMARYQGIVVVKLDRLTRSVRQWDDLRIWADANNKTIISIAESLDLSTSIGRMFANLLAMFAAFERERQSERREDASRKLYGRGGYNGGGSLPWGYRTERVNGQIVLKLDTELTVMINEIVDNVIGGVSVVDQALEHELDPASLLRRLKKAELKGWVTYHGEIVRADSGMPMLREPVITPEKWSRLRNRLNANAKGVGVPRHAYEWLHILVCARCNESLYLQKRVGTDRSYLHHNKSLTKYKQFGNPKPCTISVSGRTVHPMIAPFVMRAFGDLRVPEVTELEAEDHADELGEVEQAISDLESDRYQRGLFKGDAGTARYVTMMTQLETNAEELRSMPQVPARREVTLSEDTFRQRWDALRDDHERGDLLRRMKVKIYVHKLNGGNVRLQLRQGAGRRNRGGEDPAEYASGDT